MKLEGQVRIPSGCAIAAAISRGGKRMTGEMIINAMKPMHNRSNGLGGGFAGYGIYPEYKEFYALHMFFDCRSTRKDCEVFLKEHFEIVKSEIMPTRKIPAITTMIPNTFPMVMVSWKRSSAQSKDQSREIPLFAYATDKSI